MHFIVSFEIEGASQKRREELLSEMAHCFAEYESVQAVSGTFVIQIIGYGIYEHIQKELLKAARAVEDHTVRFMMSPIIQRGVYHGRMSEGAAKKINTLTD
jgi:hypothetical protein